MIQIFILIHLRVGLYRWIYIKVPDPWNSSLVLGRAHPIKVYTLHPLTGAEVYNGACFRLEMEFAGSHLGGLLQVVRASADPALRKDT